MAGGSGNYTRPPENRLWGADRAILYLEGPVEALKDLDGSREQDFRAETQKFLNSPESAFEKHPSAYISHIRELGSKTRGFATWCQNGTIDCELCVLHEIYRKENENRYWPDLDAYNAAGKEFAERFRGLDARQYDAWLESVEAGSDGEIALGD